MAKTRKKLCAVKVSSNGKRRNLFENVGV